MATSKSLLPKRILLKGGDDATYEEAPAGGTIVPGELVKLVSDGTVVVEDGAGEQVEKAFALEDALQGRTIDNAYVITERVFYVIAEPGDVIYAFLAAGEMTNIGDQLISAGAGHLKVEAGSEAGQDRCAVALEAVDNSHSPASAGKRIRVRII